MSREACYDTAPLGRSLLGGMGASLGLWGREPDDEGDDTEETGRSAESTHTEEVPGGLVDGISGKLTSRSGSRGSRGSKGGGGLSASTRSSMEESPGGHPASANLS